MALRNYLLAFSLLLFVTFGNSFNMKYVMDILNVIETKFDAKMDALENKLETENKLRRLEVEELFRIVSQLTGDQMLTKTEDSLPAKNLTPNQQLTTVSLSTEKQKPSQLVPDLQSLQSYLIRGAKIEKEESVNIRTKLTGIGKQLENDYAVFQSKLKDEISNITSFLLEKQNLLLNETRQSLRSFKSDVEASILELSSSLRNVNVTADESVQRCINISDSSAILTATAMFEMRNETRQYLDSMKSDVEASSQLLKSMRPSSCKSASDRNGVLLIYPETFKTPILRVYCDQSTDGGGWIVIQRRQDGSVNFERTWADYKIGFGNTEAEFWIGNENLHALTSAGFNELRIDMEDFERNRCYAKYNNFKVKSESEKYVIEISGYSGNAGDSLASHNKMPFSTKDRDNDNADYNCAIQFRGAWWYNNCRLANLNGYYYHGANSPPGKGVTWYSFRGDEYSLKRVEIKIRK